MNKTAAILIVNACTACAIFAQAQPSPAEISIRKAQEQIAKQPQNAAYNTALAMAYARRARETSDVAYYQKAEDTLKRSFDLSPGDFEALKVQTWLLLGRHEFAKALDSASKLNQKMLDDVMVYGYLADANTELGNYPEAVKAVQWMLNMKPGNIPGLTRAAYQRELHGDISGAIELMQMAHDSTPFQELEDRAWILTQIAHLNLIGGNLEEAGKYASGALGLFPGYHYAQGTLAQIRMEQKRYDEAIALLEARYKAAPHAENLFSLAEALDRAGRKTEAAQAFAQFEQMSLRESGIADNSNHELIAYYVDYAKQPEKALEIAERELARRRDILTLDAHAWALAALGRYQEANAELAQALALGVKDPKVLHHAEAIAAHLQHAGSQPRGTQPRRDNACCLPDPRTK